MDAYGYRVSYLYTKIRQFIQPYINQYITYKPDIDMIYDNKIFISDFYLLKSFGITHIVSAVVGLVPQFPDDFKYYMVEIGDTQDAPIDKKFRLTNNFIDNALNNKKNKVLIHCMYGISRSVTLTCAYLMSTLNISSTEALKMIMRARPKADPNEGFRNKLSLFLPP